MATGVYGGDCVALHHVYITDRGGKNRVGELIDISQVQWGRVRDDVSQATVLIRGSACSAQADLLSSIEPHRSELVIYRGSERVWEGPVNRVGWHSDYVEVNAHDVFEYLNGRPLSVAWNNAYPNNTLVTTRLDTIVDYELTHTYMYRDSAGNPVVLPAWENLDPPINVLPYWTVHNFPNEVGTAASTTPFQMTVGEHIDNYARTGGIDYTVVGRAIHVWDTSRSLGQTRTVTEADFFGEIVVSAYGADHSSVGFTVADDGTYGGFGGVPSTWRWSEKTGAGPGTATTGVPGGGSNAKRPSVLDLGSRSFGGYRYWLAYEATASNNFRVIASKNGSAWVDVSEENVDAESGTGVTPGNFPTLAQSDNPDLLWLFFVGTDGHLYRTRSEDGIDWTVKIDLWTPTGGIVLRSPSIYYNPNSERWVLFAVDDNTDQMFWMTSTTKELDGAGQWGAITYASVDGSPALNTVEMRYIGQRWIVLALIGSGFHILESKTSLASGGFYDHGSFVSGLSGPGKPTWSQSPNGDLDIWYSNGGIIYRLTASGPAPVIGTGDTDLDYYGPWTKMFTVFDEENSPSPTQADLNSQAKRNMAGRTPVPIEVRVPDNSSIRTSPGWEIDDLVPGVHVPLLATLNSRQMSQMQKLDKVTVTETSDGETIQVVLLPATKEDSDEEED